MLWTGPIQTLAPNTLVVQNVDPHGGASTCCLIIFLCFTIYLYPAVGSWLILRACLHDSGYTCGDTALQTLPASTEGAVLSKWVIHGAERWQLGDGIILQLTQLRLQST